MDEKLFTIQDIIDAWEASDDYREQIDRIAQGYSNLSSPTYLNKQEYLKQLIEKI
jgi:hypothetical protein